MTDRPGAPDPLAACSVRRVIVAVAGALILTWLIVAPVAACSPPFEEPTIKALGPTQVVVVGTIGERVAGGRIFHVEQAWNGVTATSILIAFKEGEPVGDCSYPVTAGQRLVIAPFLGGDGRLAADLSTLQADPATEAGRRYLAEAAALFGPGIVPTTPAIVSEPRPEADVSLLLAALAIGVPALFAGAILLARRRRVRDDG